MISCNIVKLLQIEFYLGTKKEIVISNAVLLYYVCEDLEKRRNYNNEIMSEYYGLILKTGSKLKNLLNIFAPDWTHITKPLFNSSDLEKEFFEGVYELSESLAALHDQSYSDLSIYFRLLKERLSEEVKTSIEA